jgi:hypothetical protein
MKMDNLVKQRFLELTEKAVVVKKSYKNPLTTNSRTFYRLDNEKFTEWAINVLNLLQRIFGENSVHYQNFTKHYQAFDGLSTGFEVCRGIFTAAKEDYENGYLFIARSLIKAEVSTDILEQATDLLNAGYKDPACAIAGVALETALKELCARNGISTAKLDTMNVEICKKGIYNLGMQKQITAWAHWRNKAAHGEWNEYNDANVDDMIKGITRFIAEQL